MYTKTFFLRITFAALLWWLLVLNFQKVNGMEGIQTFDPFQILEISTDATEKEIRKQYRKLSLLKHPDKNPDDPLAV